MSIKGSVRMMNKWKVAWFCPIIWTCFWREKEWNPKERHPSAPVNRALKSKLSGFHQSHADHIKSCLRRITHPTSGRVRQTLSNALSRYYTPESEGEKGVKKSGKNQTMRDMEANKAENEMHWQRGWGREKKRGRKEKREGNRRI